MLAARLFAILLIVVPALSAPARGQAGEVDPGGGSQTDVVEFMEMLDEAIEKLRWLHPEAGKDLDDLMKGQSETPGVIITMNLSKRNVLAVLAPTVIGLAWSCQPPQQGGGPAGAGAVSVGPPPHRLQGFDAEVVVPVGNGMSIRSSFSTLGQSVRWTWLAEDGLAMNLVTQTGYYPTLVKPVLRDGSLRYFVAGKHPISGSTVIEEWIPNPPTLVEEPTLGVKRLRGGSVRSVRSLFDASNLGMDMIESAWRDSINEDLMFVQYWDSQDVYILDLVAGNQTLLASSFDPLASLGVPCLSEHDHKAGWSRNHTSLGSIQVLVCDTESSQCLILTDSNSDGVPDAYVTADDECWASMGFQSASSYSD